MYHRPGVLAKLGSGWVLCLLIGSVALGALLWTLSSAAAMPEAKTPAPSTSAVAAGPVAAAAAGDAQQDALVAQGKKRYEAYKCADCHGKNGEGTDDAPDLTHSKKTAEEVSKFLVKPSTDAQTKGMPDIPLNSPDHKPLVAYVMSLRAK